MTPWQYSGRRALITGASAGIGEVFARRLAERGMNVIVTARREDRLVTLADELRQRFGVEAVPIAADLADQAEVRRLWDHATAIGEIDLLVNNAGFGAQGPFHEVELQRHVDLVEVNCTAPMILAYLALAGMRARRSGGIINVSSIAAYQPVPTLGSYAASKAMLLSLSEAMWVENRDSGVRVLALCPGRTPTEFQQVAGTGSVQGTFGSRTPEQVVDQCLEDFEAGKSHSIPGVENAVATWAVRAIPRGPLTRAMKQVVKRFWKR